MIKPNNIPIDVWEKSKLRAKTYVTRVRAAFPKATDKEVLKRVNTYIRMDLMEKKK